MKKESESLEEKAERYSRETRNPCVVIGDEIIAFTVPEKEGEDDGNSKH